MHTIQELIDQALKEDIGSGDITTENLVDPDLRGTGRIVAKESLVLAGLDVAKGVFTSLDGDTTFQHDCRDGDMLENGDVAMHFEGKLRALLMGERTALNFLQHLSGIATCVREYANLLEGVPIRLVDTRKTTPGIRVLEKYAVRAGGGKNHRMGLYDGVLIKDNHIAAGGGITPAIQTIRDRVSHLVKIEIEAENLAEVKEAVSAGADVILLDNMNADQIREAVSLIDHRAVVEVSGNVTKENVRELADTGVDIISIGAMIHSARSVDLSMRLEPIKR